jgi:hypothetical protein
VDRGRQICSAESLLNLFLKHFLNIILVTKACRIFDLCKFVTCYLDFN